MKHSVIMKPMEEKIPDHPGVPEEQYHTLGAKTLWIFALQRMHAVGVFLLLAMVLFVSADQSFLTKTPVGNLAPYVLWGAEICFALFILGFGLVFFIAWLIYTHYKFLLGEDSLKIKRGILTKEEVAIPYRQIQDVDIERDLSFQALGLSRIVILTAGHDDEKTMDDKSEGILPALDKDLAEWLQAELLKRANVQKVVEEAK